MSDSEDKKSPQVLPITPPEGTSLVVIRNKDGSTRQSLRSASGAFVKKPKAVVPSVEFTRKERKILYSPSKIKDGMTEHEVAFRHILSIAQGQSESDPKADMASVKAYEIMMRRALGKEAPSEQELDKLTTQPVKVVVIQAPQLMHPEIQEEKPQEVLKPSFAEVIGIETNPKP